MTASDRAAAVNYTFHPQNRDAAVSPAPGPAQAAPEHLNEASNGAARALTHPAPREADRRLKIAILGSRGYPSTYGGFETFVRHIAPAWARRGHAVTAYTRARGGDPGTRVWAVDGVRCIWTPGRNSNTASTLSFGLTSHVDAALRDFDVALVLNVANGFYLPLLAARGIPTVLNTDGIEWRRGKWGRTARRVFYKGAQLSARYADVLVSDSNAVADVWSEEFGVRPVFIPYGAEVRHNVGTSRIARLGLPSRSYALSVARLIPENNVELTLDALAALSWRRPAVVVGAAGSNSRLKARLRDLDNRGRVRWLGHVHDQELLIELWGNCGVYLHGHSVGGTNPGLLQALGAGAPTLALDTPFNREVLPNEDQLYPRDAGQLAEGIDAVIGQRGVQLEWAARGRSNVERRYPWESTFDAYERALRTAISIASSSR